MAEILLTEGRDFSVLDLVMDADPFVQAIMLLLVVVCSVATWVLIFEKMIRLALLRRQVGTLARLAKEGRLSFDGRNGVVGAIATAAQSEWVERAAIATLDRAEPFPPAPESVQGPLKWSIPFNYR